jgi:hypothetical protein
MPPAERRSIAELAARYHLEPTLRDIIVEGDFDRRVVEWVFSQIKEASVVVYTVDTVDVNASMVHKYGLNVGERGEVIALAGELTTHIAPDNVAISCVADRDLPEDKRPEFPHLFYTDPTSMEGYFINDECLAKFFRLFLGRELSNQLLQDFRSVLQQSMHIRRAKMVLCPEASWVTISRCCELVDGRIRFDARELVRRLLIGSGRGQLHEDMMHHMETRTREEEVPNGYAHGHDAIQLLCWYIGSVVSEPSMRNAKVVERTLSMAGDISHLSSMPLFSTLIRRTTMGN